METETIDQSELSHALSIPQAAKILGLNPVTLYRWIKKGKIKVIQKNRFGNFYIPRSEIENAQKVFYVEKTKANLPFRRLETAAKKREHEAEIAYLKSVGAYPTNE